MKWVLARWVQFTAPRTDEFEMKTSPMPRHLDEFGIQMETIRRHLSIEMVDHAYDTLGWQIMTDPYLVTGRMYDPEDETDENMPATTYHPLPSYLTHREILQMRFSEGGDEVSLCGFSRFIREIR